MRGVLFATMAQLVYATTLLMVNRKLGSVSPFIVNFSIVFVGSLSLLPILFFVRRDVAALVQRADAPWFWLILVGIVWVAVAQNLFVVGAQLGDARLVALTALFFPVFVTIIELAFGKPLDLRFVLGFILMAAGFAIILTRQS
jgi:drug/metabolite transporter (DMT)-like permease